jgi:hypothetical protein
MKTRSQTKYVNFALYEVIIDFDEASREWKSNKRSIGNGSYKYVCAKKGKNNKCCSYKCLPQEIYCKTHFTLSPSALDSCLRL